MKLISHLASKASIDQSSPWSSGFVIITAALITVAFILLSTRK